jgi:hypothetical protein
MPVFGFVTIQSAGLEARNKGKGRKIRLRFY